MISSEIFGGLGGILERVLHLHEHRGSQTAPATPPAGAARRQIPSGWFERATTIKPFWLSPNGIWSPWPPPGPPLGAMDKVVLGGGPGGAPRVNIAEASSPRKVPERLNSRPFCDTG